MSEEAKKYAARLLKDAATEEKAGRPEEALVLLRQALKSVPIATFPISEMGRIEFTRGNCPAAVRHYRDYLDRRAIPMKCGAAREPLDEVARVAMQRIEKCENTGAALIESDPKGATVRLDGGKDPAAVTPHPICNLAAGTHRAVIEESGYEPARIEFEVKPAELTTVPRVVLSPAALPPPPPAPPPSPPQQPAAVTPAVPATPETPPPTPKWYQRGGVWGAIVGGVVLVGGGVGAGVYLGTRSRTDWDPDFSF